MKRFHRRLLLAFMVLWTHSSQNQTCVDAFSTLRPSFFFKRRSRAGSSSQRCYYSPNAKSLSKPLSLSKNSFMDRLHGESDDAYFKRILAVASDPKSFENAVIRQTNTEQIQASSAAVSNSTSPAEVSSDSPVLKKGGYVRAEDWEAEERRKAKNASSWEERVQFDGQRHGNRFSQNEILRHHLKGF